MDKLTHKQEIFCAEYLIDGNATRAAKSAGYSEKTATVIGAQNLTKLNVRAKISELRDKWLDEIGEDSKAISRRLRQFLFDENYQASPADRLKAADMLNKMTGGYELDNAQKEPTVFKIIRTSRTVEAKDDGTTK